MAKYSYIIAREYNLRVEALDPSLMREILWFAPLHDIGKIGIPDNILHKPGPLSPEEREAMEKHVEIGERVISTMTRRLEDTLSHSLMRTAVDIIAGHHEKFNGKGYPRGLRGTDISIAGRIVAVADVFDALTSRRPYKEAYPMDKALAIMERDMEGHFDPQVLGCLFSAMGEISEVYQELKEI
jgi:HD-GYP domain-containing protein (c-di-GMP phosphodiesterase class II)